MGHSEHYPQLSASDLIREIDIEIEESNARIQSYDEAAAIREAQLDDGKTTDQRAIEALERPERFYGEHQVARAWLFNHSNTRIWTKKT